MALQQITSMAFKVAIDGLSLGTFTACDGLNVEISVESYEEGGNNDFIYQLPGRIKYTNVKLTRAASTESTKIYTYFKKLQKEGVKRSSASITALTQDGNVIQEWKLKDVFPVKWNGPSFTTDSAKAATETLELAHHGFL